MLALIVAAALAVQAAPAPSAPAPPARPVVRSAANLPSLFSDADYPADALRNREQGIVGIRLDIDSAGRVAACTVTESAGSASLDAATCRLLTQRARFRPATDAAGHPVPDAVTTRIVWRIDEARADPAVAAATQLWLRCLHDVAVPLLRGPASADEIANRSYAACSAEEEDMRGSLAKPGLPAFRSEDARREFRPTLLRMIDEARPGVRR